jgi:acyl-coenzyme A synthetase/AMP-(fatty) acid ligase
MARLPIALSAVLSIDPTAPAIEFHGRWRSWGRLATDARAVGNALAAAGFGSGTRIGVVLRNQPEVLGALLGILIAQACLASLNAAAPDERLAADIESLRAPVLIATEADWDRGKILDAARAGGALCLALTDDEHSPLRIVAACDPRAATRWQSQAPGMAIEMLSSGTTGAPKRIPLSVDKLEQALEGAASYEKGRGDNDAPRLRSGVQIVTAPLAHIAGITGVLNNVLAGRKVCLIEKFSVAAFTDAVRRHRPKVAGAPPSAIRMILDAHVPKDDLSSLVAFRTGTAPLDPALADAFQERYGIPVLQNYGATEFAGGAAGWTLDDFRQHWSSKRGSVGRLNAGVHARTRDPESREVLAAGAEGLLELRAPNIGDGKSWVATTDLAVVDADGFLWIKGRHDGAIIRGGFKIQPDDVVRALERHPAIREAAVVALPDPRLGQVPAAGYIVRNDMPAPTDDDLRAFLREHLMPYQIPSRFMRMTDLPRTVSMKPNQVALRALFESQPGEAAST